MQSEAVKWRRRSVDDCVWADYGDASVIFHRPSGTTHLLNRASVILLSEILVEPTGFDEILSEMCAAEQNQTEFRQELESVLRRFEYLGFIEATGPASDD